MTPNAMHRPLYAEIHHTRTLLESIPEERLTWKPHRSAISLGQLSLYLATLPSMILDAHPSGAAEASAESTVSHPEDKARILRTFEAALTPIVANPGLLQDAFTHTVSLSRDRFRVIALSHPITLERLLTNHWQHHRGHLEVYLRLLGSDFPADAGE